MIQRVFRKAGEILAQKPFRLWGISLLCGVLGFAATILFGIIPGVNLAIAVLLDTGMIMVYLHGFRGEEVRAVQLFDCCRDWATVKRVLAGVGWQALFTFLWALIPVAGVFIAIYKSYCWRLTPYILVQEPEVAPTEAIKVSAERTNGFKGKMFGADIIIVAITAVLLAILSALHLTILFTIFTILFLLFLPLFCGLVQAGFYEEINAAGKAPEAPEADLQ